MVVHKDHRDLDLDIYVVPLVVAVRLAVEVMAGIAKAS